MRPKRHRRLAVNQNSRRVLVPDVERRPHRAAGTADDLVHPHRDIPHSRHTQAMLRRADRSGLGRLGADDLVALANELPDHVIQSVSFHPGNCPLITLPLQTKKFQRRAVGFPASGRDNRTSNHPAISAASPAPFAGPNPRKKGRGTCPSRNAPGSCASDPRGRSGAMIDPRINCMAVPAL